MAPEPQPNPGGEEAAEPKEPLILWWMPLLALAAPAVWAVWTIVSADSQPLQAAAESLLWPGALRDGANDVQLYLVDGPVSAPALHPLAMVAQS